MEVPRHIAGSSVVIATLLQKVDVIASLECYQRTQESCNATANLFRGSEILATSDMQTVRCTDDDDNTFGHYSMIVELSMSKSAGGIGKPGFSQNVAERIQHVVLGIRSKRSQLHTSLGAKLACRLV